MASRHWLNKTLPLTAAALLLAGCGGGNTIPDPEPTDTVGGSDGANTSGGAFDDWGAGEDVPAGFDSAELSDTIYFEFDSYEVGSGDAEIVSRHSVQILENGASVRLEGHADERGSREYNIGLGERRAQAVRRMLMIQGVPAAQISTVSFGEERPAEFGSDETAYAANRRVVIRYEN